MAVPVKGREMQEPVHHPDWDRQPDDRYLRTSLKKAFQVLDLFSTETTSLRLSDISKLLNVSSSSLFPTLYTLEQFGYLKRDGNRRYSLGLKLLERTNVLLNSLDLRDKAKPHLKDLADTCQANAHLAIRNGWNVLYLEREVASPDVVFSHILGRQAPVHCTALGKALIAHEPDEIVQDFLNDAELAANTPNTIVDPRHLQTALTEIGSQGYAVDNEELHEGVMCVAAPVFDYENQVIAAVSISFPKTETMTQQLEYLAECTTEAAREISRSMGAQLPGS